MVKYDSYEKKMRQVATVKNFVVRFKVFFITLAITIIALTSGFLGTKGVVTSNVSLPSEIIYGEEIVIEEADVLFNDDESVYYEYFDEASQTWSKNKPVAPGNYQVRAVTSKSFNTVGYSKPVSFTIKPKNVEFIINDTSVVYGSNPSDYDIDLSSNDTLLDEQLSFIFDSVVLKQTQVQVDLSSIVIVDKEGKDVTSYYNISTSKSDITYVEKEIDVVPFIESKIYDGTPITYNNEFTSETQASLIEGDVLEIKTSIKNESGEVLTSYPKDVGTYTIVVDSYTIVNDSISNIDNYKVNLKETTFQINKRDIKITTASKDKMFDGVELYLDPSDENNYSVTNIVSSHKIVLDDSKTQKTSITNVGSVENKYVYKVVDEKDIDVTSNYNITYSYGTLQVLKNEISIVIDESLEKVYDQLSFDIDDITWTTLNPLPSGYSLRVKDSDINNFVNVGTYNFKANFEVYDENDNNVTDQFVFIDTTDGYYYSSLTITTKELIITLNDIEKDYDGANVLHTDVTYSQVGLLTNNTIIINSFADETASYLYASTYEYNIDFDILYNNVSVKDNYNITINDASIIINKTNITVNMLDINKQYDTKEFVKEDAIYQLVDNLPINHLLTIADINIIDTENYPNVGTYQYNATFVITNNNEDVTNNYIITVNKANAVIDIFNLEIDLFALTKTYDAKYFEIKDIYEVLSISQNLPDNVVLVMLTNTIENDITINASTYEFDATFDITLNDESIYSNFNVTVLKDYLTINQREVAITSASSTYVYDGYDHYNRSVQASNLVTNHIVKIDETQDNITINDVGVVSNDYRFEIVDENNNVVTPNYSYNYVIGELEVTPLTIVIKPTSKDSVVYSGDTSHYDSNNYEIITDISHVNPDIVDTLSISLYVEFHLGDENNTEPYVSDANIYKMEIVNIDINYFNNFVVEEYDDEMYFEIKKYPYTIDDLAIDYDLLYGQVPEAKQHELLNGDIVIPMLSYVEKQDYINNNTSAVNHSIVYDAATYYVNCDGYYFLLGNKDNYDITIGVANYTKELVISPRTIYVNLYEIENFIYNGEYVSYLNNNLSNNYVYTLDSVTNEDNQVLANELIGFNVLIKNNNETSEAVKDVGVYTYQYEPLLIMGSSLNNYVIVVVNKDCDFEISPREVSITTMDINSNTSVYDARYVSYDYLGANNFAYDDVSIDNVDKQFVSGEELEIVVLFTIDNNIMYSHIIDANTYNVVVSELITNDALLLDNYILTINDNKQYTITKRDINVTFVDDEREYNGEKLVNNNYYVDELADGDYIILSGEEVSVTDVDEGDITNVYEVSIYSSKTNVIRNDYVSNDIEYDITHVNYTLTINPGILRILPRTIYVKPITLEDKVYEDIEVTYPNNQNNFEYVGASYGLENKDHQMVDTESLSINIYYKDENHNKLDYAPYNVGTYYIFIETNEYNEVTFDNYQVINGKKSNYRVIFEDYDATSFNITPRVVYITALKYQDFVYDGYELTYDENFTNYRVHKDSEYDLVSSHLLKVQGYFMDENYNITTVRNAGKYYVSIYEDLFTLINAKGENVLFNYDINVVFDENDNTFEVLKRKVLVDLYDIDDKTYDGNYVVYEDHITNYDKVVITNEYYPLADGEYLQVSVEFSNNVNGNNKLSAVRNADTYYVFITDYSISGSNDVKANYIIEPYEKEQSFTIDKKTVRVTLNNIEDKTYDGNYISYSTNVNNYDLSNSDELAANEYLTLIVKFTNADSSYDEIDLSSIVDVSTYYARIIDYSISGSNDVKENYIIKQIVNGVVQDETVTISKKILIVQADPGELVYIGQNLPVPNYYFYTNVDEIDADLLPEIKVKGQALLDGVWVDKVLDADTYKVRLILTAPLQSRNFALDENFLEGTLLVNPTTNYENLQLDELYSITYGENFDEIKFKALGDDEIIVKIQAVDNNYDPIEAINYGYYTIVGVEYRFVNTKATNYVLPDVTSLESELFIDKLYLIVDLNIISTSGREYDGNETVYEVYAGNYSKLTNAKTLQEVKVLPYGDSIAISALMYLKETNAQQAAINKGIYLIKYDSFAVLSGNKSTENYDIIQSDLILEYEIKERTIYINPLDIDENGLIIYDGMPVTYDTEFNNFVYATSDSAHKMVIGQQLRINVKFYDTNWNELPDGAIYHGTYFIKIVLDDFEVAGENALTSNYKLIQVDEEVTFIISKRTIVISVDELSHVYSGYAFDYEGGSMFNLEDGTSIVNDDQVRMKVTFTNERGQQLGKVENVGKYKVTLDYIFIEGDGQNVANNYTATFKKAFYTYEITVRTLVLNPTYEDTLTYDGKKELLEGKAYSVDYFTLDSLEGLNDRVIPNFEITLLAYYLDGDNPSVGNTYIKDAGTYALKAFAVDYENSNFDIKTETGYLVVEPKEFYIPLVNEEITYGDEFELEKMYQTGVNDEQIGILIDILDENSIKTTAKNVGTYIMQASTIVYGKDTLEKNYTITNDLQDIKAQLEILKLYLHVELNDLNKFNTKNLDNKK